MLHGLDSRRQEAGCKCLHVFGTSFCCCHSISEKRNIAFVRKQVLLLGVCIRETSTSIDNYNQSGCLLYVKFITIEKEPESDTIRSLTFAL